MKWQRKRTHSVSLSRSLTNPSRKNMCAKAIRHDFQLNETNHKSLGMARQRPRNQPIWNNCRVWVSKQTWYDWTALPWKNELAQTLGKESHIAKVCLNGSIWTKPLTSLGMFLIVLPSKLGPSRGCLWNQDFRLFKVFNKWCKQIQNRCEII